MLRPPLPRPIAALAALLHGVASAAPPPAASTTAADGFLVIASLAELRQHAARDGAKIRLKPGTYFVEEAPSRRFFELSGRDSHWDLRGVTLRIDTKLFRQFAGRDPVGSLYCVFHLAGDRLVFEGVKTENFGDLPGVQSKNKIFNLTGSGIILRDVDLTTSGSSPWGYGSLYGISSGDVRKMNGIRVGWPARDIQLIGCRVHMRAMGHAIFVQGATNTMIRDCHVDGLLRPTSEILAECTGYAFERNFRTRGHAYSEGVSLGAEGEILPGEIIALSEDGIRLYPDGGPGRPTGRTVIEGCTVTRMRRGICTGLGPAADLVTNCEVRECVATGYNAGSGDVIQHCRADAKYAEALCLPYMRAQGAKADLEVLDSRGGFANELVAVLNGSRHEVHLRSAAVEHVPAGMRVEVATLGGYAFYQRREPVAIGNHLINETAATVVLHPPAADNTIESRGAVTDRSRAPTPNRVRRL